MEKRTRQKSLVGEMKHRLLIIAFLFIFVLIFFFPLNMLNTFYQHSLDERQSAIQNDLSDVLIGMVNQETGLRGYIGTDKTIFLQPFISGRLQYLHAVSRAKEQMKSSGFRKTAMAFVHVEERANTWYNIYGLQQLKNMQSGKATTALSERAFASGKAFFDQFRTAVTSTKSAFQEDVSDHQIRSAITNILILTIGVVLTIIALLILWFIFTTFTKALHHLTILKTIVCQFGSGDLSVRIQEMTYQELNTLGQTFNQMADLVAYSRHELEQTNRESLLQRDDLVNINNALKEASRVRDQFLATMSHELRTPLASIIGFSEMLLEDVIETGANQQQQENLERILKNSEHLLELINDVLDLSKIEAGRMPIDYRQVSVPELLSSVTKEIQSLAVTHNLVLQAEVEEGVTTLETDQRKLHQILLNLLSNALKFTEQGTVILSTTHVFLPDQRTEGIAFAVKDTGIGIPPDIQKDIFEPFYQADMSYTRKVGGTGLGLAIVSQLTALLGGTVALESTPGRGSTFTVTLPLKAGRQYIEQDIPRLHPEPYHEVMLTGVSEALEEAGQPEAREGKNNLILVVDDNTDVIDLVKAALRDMPYTVVGTQDSLNTMKLVQELSPSAIILDVMIPRLNGWQLLHQLKNNPATISIPVVMLTVLSEQTTGYVLGADDYVIKPFKKEVLCHTLQYVIETKKGHAYASRG